MQPDANKCPNRLRQVANLARYGTIAVLVAMFVGTHIPMEASGGFVQHDKMLHFWAYLTLAFAVITTWDLSAGRLQGSQYLMVWLGCAIYGIADELLQIPVGRSCDAMDWVFDIAGAAAGVLLFRVVRPLVYRMALLIPVAARP
jgi:VanZ family protein